MNGNTHTAETASRMTRFTTSNNPQRLSRAKLIGHLFPTLIDALPVDALVAQPPDNRVGADNQEQPDDAFEDANSHSHAQVPPEDAVGIDIGVEHLPDVEYQRVDHEKHLLEVDADDPAQPQDQQHHDDVPNGRQGHAEDLPPSAGAVDSCRLVQFGRNAGYGGKEDDGAPARVFPDILHDEDSPEEVRILEKRHRLDVRRFQRLVHETHIRRKQEECEARYDDPRQKVGQIDNGLGDAFQGLAPDLTQKNSQDDRCRKEQKQIEDVDRDRITQYQDEALGLRASR